MKNLQKSFSVLNLKRYFSILFVLVVVILCLSACLNPWQKDEGIIIIELGTTAESGRSLLPWPPQNHGLLNEMKHKITISGDGITLPIIEITGSGTHVQPVSAGYWTVRIDAFLEGEWPFNPSGETIYYASGSKSVDVKDGENVTVRITMEPVCQECKEHPCGCEKIECLCKDDECICDEDCECDCENCHFDPGCGECGECEDCNPVCEHDFLLNWTETKPATCTEEGSEENKCAVCEIHAEGSPREIEKLEHNFPVNWTEIKPATCAEAGSEDRRCPDCETHADNSPRVITQLGHIFDLYHSNNDARCEVDGTKISYCERIGCQVPDTVTDTGTALEHLYPAWQVPTCTIPGNSTRTCTRIACGNAETRSTGFQALGHSFVENWSGTPAACLTQGNETRTCIRNCGEANNTQQRNTPPLGHDHFQSLACTRGSCGFQYTLNATGPAGGRIFYIATNGFNVQGYGIPGQDGHFAAYRAHYLEAAPENAVGGTGEQATMRWSIGTSIPYPDVENTGTGFGAGRNNTALIIATEKAANPSSAYVFAALACVNYFVPGYETFRDWFLPSGDELNQIYIRRLNLGIPSASAYWSSSQFIYASVSYPNSAWFQIFMDGGDGHRGDYGKDKEWNVRPIRAF